VTTLSDSAIRREGVGADGAPTPYVAIVRWPEESDNVVRLRAAGTPRLLLVAPDASAPQGSDCDEDWIRLPAADDDVRVRAAAVAERSLRHSPHPFTSGDGRLAFRGRWVALSQTEEAMARILADHFGEVVDAETLAGSRGADPLSENALRVLLHRLRRRIGPLGLVVRTVHGRGCVLESAD
jgi:hypothetical protein